MEWVHQDLSVYEVLSRTGSPGRPGSRNAQSWLAKLTLDVRELCQFVSLLFLTRVKPHTVGTLSG